MQFRFYYPHKITTNHNIIINQQTSHHIKNVLRSKEGDEILCFNGEEEWLCKITLIHHHQCNAIAKTKTREERPHQQPKIHLLIAAIKHDAMHEAISNATQIGATQITPIITQRCITKKTSKEKLQLIAEQSAAQCNRITVPQIEEHQTLDKFLDQNKKTIAWASEAMSRQQASQSASAYCLKEAIKTLQEIFHQEGEIAILIGPEGGLTSAELEKLKQHKHKPISLGNNILRSQTAVTSAIQLAVISAIKLINYKS